MLNKKQPQSSHEVAQMALHWLQHFSINRPFEMSQIVESLYANATRGNKLAVNATMTLDNMENNKDINALDMLSLCWLIRSLYDGDHLHEQENTDGEERTEEGQGQSLERLL